MNELEWPEGTTALLDEILTDAYGDDEQLWAIRQAFEDVVEVPTDTFVIGEPVEDWEKAIVARGPRPSFEMAQLLPWGLFDNRPFLRCMHGSGLCFWRLGRERATATLFERMLWLNPADNQGIRFLLLQIRAGERTWDHRI